MRRLVLVVLLLLVALAAAGSPSLGQRATPRHRPGRVWVRLKEGDRSTLGQRADGLAAGRVERVEGRLNAAVLSVAPGQETQVAAELATRPEVEYALPIPMAQAQVIPNDPGFSLQWGLSVIGAPQAWGVVRAGSSTVIAVLDTGIDLTHPDLASRLWTNPGEVPGNGLDDDGNGYVDDIHGWNLVSGTAAVADDYGHGTHVAGIAAAATGNGVGVAGVSWGAQVMVVKVLDATGNGYYDDIVSGIYYAADNGAKVINLSLGGADPWPPLQEALVDVRARGVFVVAAAGNHWNSSQPTYVLYPAAYPEAMAIAATDSADRQASFSNYGPQVSVAAPGSSIYSTWPAGSYGYMSGTSMATPHVAGLAALVWARYPWFTVDEVQARIESTASDVNAAGYPGWDQYLGYGRIDAASAIGDWPYHLYLPQVRTGH